jgi:hypothetical protein
MLTDIYLERLRKTKSTKFVRSVQGLVIVKEKKTPKLDSFFGASVEIEKY